MRISDWSSDVCSSDLRHTGDSRGQVQQRVSPVRNPHTFIEELACSTFSAWDGTASSGCALRSAGKSSGKRSRHFSTARSEEHTSELQSLMRISYAVFCLNKKTIYTSTIIT